MANDLNEEEIEQPQQSSGVGKKLAGKGAKLAAKGVAKLLLMLGKLLVTFIWTVVIPFILNFWLIIVCVIGVFILTTMLFGFFGSTDYEYTSEEEEMAEFVQSESASTIDQDKVEQRPYQLPVSILVASSQLELYASDDADNEERKDIISDMAEQLSPEFTYGEFTPKIKKTTLTCEGDDCDEEVDIVDGDPVSLITQVVAWDGTYDIEYEREWGNTDLVNKEEWEETKTYTDTEVVEVDKEKEFTKKVEQKVCNTAMNPATGGPIELCSKVEKEVPYTDTVTVKEEQKVEKTETVKYVEFKYENVQQFIAVPQKDLDYTLYESVLFGYDYTRADIRFVEALYNESGGEMMYSYWLEEEGILANGQLYSDPSHSLAPLPPVDSGEITAPTYGLITSHYGMRFHPVYNEMRMHNGTDIAPIDGIPPAIVSIADGEVVVAKYHKSAGNYIVVAHELNGQRYDSRYLHLNQINVRVGEKVSKGQQIGVMGTTGTSTGVHLHFEMFVGPYYNFQRFNPLANNQGVEFAIPSSAEEMNN